MHKAAGSRAAGIITLAALTLSLAGLAGCGGATVRVDPPVVVADDTPAPVPTGEWTRMPIRLGFPTGGNVMSAEARRQLTEVVLSASNRTDIIRVRIEGHADTTGSAGANQALSQARAQAVADALVEEGVPRRMLEVVGFGSTRPLAVEEGVESNRALNRRVEFSIMLTRDGTPRGF